MPLTTLPDPTWAQSENNLLPKWLRYLAWHKAEYGADELRRIRESIGETKRRIEHHTELADRCKKRETSTKAEIEVLRARDDLADEWVQKMYEALIESPQVVGTRIGSFGDLVVLIDPLVPGKENLDFGFFEISYQTLVRGNELIEFVGKLNKSYDFLRGRMNPRNYTYSGDEEYIHSSFFFRRDETMLRECQNFNLLPAVEQVGLWLGYHHGNTIRHVPDKSADRKSIWSGFTVSNPVAAFRQMIKMAGYASIQAQIAELEKKASRYARERASCIKQVRTERAELRSLESEMKKVEVLQAKENLIDTDEATATLRYITTLPGVIAIRFNGKVPVLHVRNSFVYARRRYDLGDFEIHLKLDNLRFGTVLHVERTRVPAGGTYESGWHPGEGFCFGRERAELIEHAFRKGDFGHALNLAIGTMNSLSEGHESRVTEGYFAEIAMLNTWQRILRKRPRRKPKIA
ncbi:MAG: hypothetical protein WBP12_03790 [Candidatus Saccharimonas sp.]